MKKVKILNREKETLEEKRVKNKSIDLRDNYILKDLKNGYSVILPIDKNKRFF